MWRKCACGAMALALAVSGCAGSAPNPVLGYQLGDEKRSCTSLKAKIASNEAQMIHLAGEKDSTYRKNVLLGVTGTFLAVPLIFMDLKGKEAGELAALRHRNRNLRQFAADKSDCTVPAPKVKFEEKEKEKKEK